MKKEKKKKKNKEKYPSKIWKKAIIKVSKITILLFLFFFYKKFRKIHISFLVPFN